MGISVRGIVCYGVPLECNKYPWEADGYDGDIDDWWLSECGYEPQPQIFNADGSWMNGTKPPQEMIDQWFDHLYEFKAQNPILVDLVYYGSGDYHEQILSVVGLGSSADWSTPTDLTFVIEQMTRDVTKSEHYQLFIDFCKKYKISTRDLGWYLCAYVH